MHAWVATDKSVWSQCLDDGAMMMKQARILRASLPQAQGLTLEEIARTAPASMDQLRSPSPDVQIDVRSGRPSALLIAHLGIQGLSCNERLVSEGAFECAGRRRKQG